MHFKELRDTLMFENSGIELFLIVLLLDQKVFGSFFITH